MNTNKNSLISSIILCCVLLMLLVCTSFAYFTNIFAWFTIGDNNDIDETTFSIMSNDSIEITNITIYRVNENDLEATKYDNLSVQDLDELIKLNKYDTVFSEKRQYIPIIVKFTLDNFSSGLQEAPFQVSIDLTDDPAKTGFLSVNEQNISMLDDYISNLVIFRLSTSLQDDDLSAEEFYIEACHYFENAENASTVSSNRFVNYEIVEDEIVLDEVKENELLFNLTKPSNQSSLDLYLYLNYDENLISKFMSDHKQATGTTSELDDYFAWGSQFKFKEDIAFIRINNVEE